MDTVPDYESADISAMLRLRATPTTTYFNIFCVSAAGGGREQHPPTGRHRCNSIFHLAVTPNKPSGYGGLQLP